MSDLSTTLSRRQVLTGAGTLAAALATQRLPRAWAAPARPDYPFTLGVASGDPLPEAVVIWTRLAPDPLADGSGGIGNRPVDVAWQVAADPQFRRVVREGVKVALPGGAHSVHVDVTGLRPGGPYWYRFRALGQISPVGRTRTAPAAGSQPSRLRFAFASCQQFEHGYFVPYQHMAREDLDLVVHLGDYIYEYGPNEYVAPGGNVRRHIGEEIRTLSDYRRRHAQYKTDPDLQAAHAAFPWILTWDDHEVENNYADENPENDVDPQEFLRRRADAYRAYYEHLPLRTAPPADENLRIYRSLQWGDLAQFQVLDTRQYRSDQPCGDGFGTTCPERFDVGRTILGAAQENWLRKGLERSRARWNVLAQQIFMAQIDLVAGPRLGVYNDGWDGYVASRNRLLRFLERRPVRNPIVLTGDWHANWLCDLRTDYADPRSPVVGTEFVGTSISSTDEPGARPDYGLTVLDENPHIRYFNNLRGYVRCDVGRGQWRSDYRVVDTVRQRQVPVRTEASFVVDSGNPRARRI